MILIVRLLFQSPSTVKRSKKSVNDRNHPQLIEVQSDKVATDILKKNEEEQAASNDSDHHDESITKSDSFFRSFSVSFDISKTSKAENDDFKVSLNFDKLLYINLHAIIDLSFLIRQNGNKIS